MTPGAAVGEWNGLRGLSQGPSELAAPGPARPVDTGLGAWARGDTREEGSVWLHPFCLHADLGHMAAPQAGEGTRVGTGGQGETGPHPSLAPALTGHVSHVPQQA